jgi:hypothetical protein
MSHDLNSLAHDFLADGCLSLRDGPHGFFRLDQLSFCPADDGDALWLTVVVCADGTEFEGLGDTPHRAVVAALSALIRKGD